MIFIVLGVFVVLIVIALGFYRPLVGFIFFLTIHPDRPYLAPLLALVLFMGFYGQLWFFCVFDGGLWGFYYFYLFLQTSYRFS